MKIGALFHVDGRSTTSLAQRMAKAQRGRDTPEPRLHDVPSGTLACIPGTDQFSNLPFVSTGSQGNILILTGTPIRTNGDLARHSQIVIESDFESATGCLSDLDGAYAAVFWHAPSERLAIVTDFLGMQPLYLAQVGGYLLIASDIRGITATGLVPLEPDEAGWGSFLSMGHFIANRTSVQNIYRAEPGTVYEYDGRAGTLQSRSYWDYPSLRNISELSQVDTGGIAAALRASVHGYLEHTDTGTVLLSGGFDSRSSAGPCAGSCTHAACCDHGARRTKITMQMPSLHGVWPSTMAFRTNASAQCANSTRRKNTLITWC